MVCTKCGKEIIKGDRFCQACGTAAPAQSEPLDNYARTLERRAGETKKDRKIPAWLMALIAAVLCLAIAGGLFKNQLMCFTYVRLAEANADKNLEKAIHYAEKAYSLDKDSTHITSLYVKKAEKLLDQEPGQAIELLLKANSYSGDKSLYTLIAKAYLKDAEKKLKFDIDGAMAQIEESLKYDKFALTNDLYAQAYMAKADKAALSNIDEAIEYARAALDYKQTEDVKKKILELYLKKAELVLTRDPQSAIDLANEAKLYGDDDRINAFIQKVNTQMQANLSASSGGKTEAQLLDELVYNYAKGVASAVSYGDFSIIEPYMVYGSNLYNTQKDFVVNAYNNGVKEEFINAYVKSYEYDAMNNQYRVYVYEEYNITYASGKVETKSYDWVYTARLQPEYGLMDISK